MAVKTPESCDVLHGKIDVIIGLLHQDTMGMASIHLLLQTLPTSGVAVALIDDEIQTFKAVAPVRVFDIPKTGN